MDSSPKPRSKRRLLFWLAAVIMLGAGAAWIINLPARRAPAVPVTAVSPGTTNSASAKDGIVAYYFHTTYRCTSCRKIEAYSRLAIESGFAGDIASGRLQIRLVNIDDQDNKHYVQDYKLYTKSLVLSERADGREVRWKNLTRVWELLNDEPAFVDYVQRETRSFLAETP